MSYKRRYIIIGLILLIIVWTGNILFYQKHILKEPLFIKHYYDVKQGMDSLRLYFIENINEKNRVAYITFPEIGEEYVSSEIWQHNSDYRYYNFKIIQVRINFASGGNIPENLKNRVITKARIYLTNGQDFDTDIGRIYLYNDRNDKNIMKFISGLGRSNNSGSTTFSTQEDLSIYEISTKFPELMDGTLDITIDDVPVEDLKFPIKYNSSEVLTVGYKFNFDRNDMDRNNAYEFSVNLLTESETGEKGSEELFVNYWLQSPEEFDINAMLSEGSSE